MTDLLTNRLFDTLIDRLTGIKIDRLTDFQTNSQDNRLIERLADRLVDCLTDEQIDTSVCKKTSFSWLKIEKKNDSCFLDAIMLSFPIPLFAPLPYSSEFVFFLPSYLIPYRANSTEKEKASLYQLPRQTERPYYS